MFYGIESALYMLGFILFVILLPLLVIAIMWIVGKIVPKLAVTRKKRRRIAYIPNIVMYILLILVVWGEKYVVTGIAEVEKENEISLPLNFAYVVKYKQTKIFYTETKYIKFVGKVSKETITRLNELCEQPKQKETREYSSRSWEKDGNVYHYKYDSYDLSIDITTNTAVSNSFTINF